MIGRGSALQTLERTKAIVVINFLQYSRSRFSLAQCALPVRVAAPVSKKFAFGNSLEKMPMNGIAPPQPTKTGSEPSNTSLVD